MNKAILLVGSKLLGLYVNNKLITWHTDIHKYINNLGYFLDLEKRYNFNLEDMEEDFLCKEDNVKSIQLNCFPTSLNKFSKEYKGWFFEYKNKWTYVYFFDR